MIQTIKPYGSISKSYLYKVFEYKGKYYLIDIYTNRYEIDEETYKELKHD